MMNRKFVAAYVWMFICTAVAGAASGILYLNSMGARAAILGISLALGIMVINTVEQKRFLERQTPRNAVVWGAAILSGLIGGVLVNFYGMGPASTPGDFAPEPTPAGLETIAVGIIYGALLHGAYSLRWKIRDDNKWRFLLALGMFAAAGLLSTVVRFLIMDQRIEKIGESLFMSLFTGVPFGMFWGVAVALTDPAWSHRKMEKMNR
jgi:hypothetical protein